MPDTHVILFGFVLRNTCEFRLEVQGITHLIEQEGQEEITPVRIKFEPASTFNSDNIFTPLPALWENVSHRTSNETSDIQEQVELVFATSFFINVGPIVKIVVDVVDSTNNGIHAFISLLVSLGEFGTDQECVHILILICLCEWLS